MMHFIIPYTAAFLFFVVCYFEIKEKITRIETKIDCLIDVERDKNLNEKGRI